MLSRCFLAFALLVSQRAYARDLQPQLVLDADGATARVAISLGTGETKATLAQGALEITVRREVGRAGETLTLEGVYRRTLWVRSAGIELALPVERATVIGRDLMPVQTRTARLGRFDPKWISAGDTTLIVDDDVDAVVVKGRRVQVLPEAVEARPFVHDARCARDWRSPNAHLPLRARLRVPGDRLHARIQLVTGATVPLVKAPFPDGRRAAFVITDHADQSSLQTFEPLVRALLRHKIPITKALFARGDPERPQLDDPRMRKLADELARGGSEIVPHSATPKPDERPVTKAALELFQRWRTRTWIDHQPETNCEAFGDQGFRSSGPYAIADLLAAKGYQYIWAQLDAPPNELNLLLPRKLDRFAPTVWPLRRVDVGGPDGLWMFRTVWAFVEANRFFKLYAPAELDRLERERGLHISHTYLETFHPKGTRFGLRNLLRPVERKGRPGRPGEVALDPRFEALLADLAARQLRGSLWVPTLGRLGDRLRTVARVTLTLRDDGAAVLSAPRAVKGATFVLHAPDADVRIGGRPPKGRVSDGQTTTFWHDLRAGDTVVRISRAGAPVALLKR